MHTDIKAAGNALHMPVLVNECITALSPSLQGQSPVMIDCTLGLGGHTEAFLDTFPHLNVVGIDRDEQAIMKARERLASFGGRFRAVHATYDYVGDIAREYCGGQADVILMDLGVSSMQIDEPERGFSYVHDGPLDMRMDTSTGVTAAQLLAEESEDSLAAILRDSSGERFARRIAHGIVERRKNEPIETTGQLAQLVKDCIPAPARRSGGNPAKRTFQALRIAVNQELSVLRKAVPEAMNALRVGGRLAVESYQSLEDKIVKKYFTQASSSHTPLGLPVELEEYSPGFRLVTRGAMKAHDEEKVHNNRSASVRLRVIEKLKDQEVEYV